tara:strand:- start:687 stop:1040 length:354 start_codon:yes stop_codon:yes gene_type:complete
MISSFVFFILILSNSNKLSAKEIEWTQVAKTNNELQFIDINSIRYNNNNLLSVVTKFSEINTDQEIINTNTYLIAIDCENRLFSKLPVDGDPKQVKNWNKPFDDKLIKKTIINSCSY